MEWNMSHCFVVIFILFAIYKQSYSLQLMGVKGGCGGNGHKIDWDAQMTATLANCKFQIISLYECSL